MDYFCGGGEGNTSSGLKHERGETRGGTAPENHTFVRRGLALKTTRRNKLIDNAFPYKESRGFLMTPKASSALPITYTMSDPLPFTSTRLKRTRNIDVYTYASLRVKTDRQVALYHLCSSTALHRNPLIH